MSDASWGIEKVREYLRTGKLEMMKPDSLHYDITSCSYNWEYEFYKETSHTIRSDARLDDEEIERRIALTDPHFFDWAGNVTETRSFLRQDGWVNENLTKGIRGYRDETWQFLYTQAGGEGLV